MPFRGLLTKLKHLEGQTVAQEPQLYACQVRNAWKERKGDLNANVKASIKQN
jgi:hypothetical protein